MDLDEADFQNHSVRTSPDADNEEWNVNLSEIQALCKAISRVLPCNPFSEYIEIRGICTG